MKYLICSDASMDVVIPEGAEQVSFIPMHYALGEETRTCVGPESAEKMHEYYEQLRRKVLTSTSQITPMEYMDYFREILEQKTGILYLSLSSGLSSTYESACLAARELREDFPEAEIEIVDTLGATGGMGLLFEKAIENRESGMSLSENASLLREMATKVVYWFKVEDLMYLKRGGRVSTTTAIVGTALSIKPILTIANNGKLENVTNKRGDKLARKELVTRFADGIDMSFGGTVYICCADCMEQAESLKEELLAVQPGISVKITMLSPIIGAHTGPDMISVIYFGNNRL